jgi:hypothetical protein
VDGVFPRPSISRARQAVFEKVRLDTIRNTGPAVRLLERHGLLEIPRYNDDPDADLFMEYEPDYRIVSLGLAAMKTAEASLPGSTR